MVEGLFGNFMKIEWNNRSILYTNYEKKIIFNSLNKTIPLTQGKNLDLFESKFKKYLKCKGNAYAVANGSNALDLTAILLNLKKNDEIILPAHTWCATGISYARFGAKLKWADIDEKTLNVNFNTIKKQITKKTKAIIVVHLYGLPVDLKKIINYAKKKKIIVIEDCAQALGASIGNKKVGTFGDMAIFSFHSNKIITTLGEGGMLVVNNKSLDKNVSSLRHNGVDKFMRKIPQEYWKPAMTNIKFLGKDVWPYNFCIGETQCLIGLNLIKRIDKLNNIRRKRATLFKNKLKEFEEIEFQKIPKNFNHVFHCLVAKFRSGKRLRDKFILDMKKKYNIQCIVQNYPLYRYGLFKKNGHGKNNCKNTDNFFDNMISWPFYTWMSDKEFNYLITSTISTLRNLRKSG